MTATAAGRSMASACRVAPGTSIDRGSAPPSPGRFSARRPTAAFWPSRIPSSPTRGLALLAGPLACVAVCLVRPSRRRLPLAARPAASAQVRAKLRVGTSGDERLAALDARPRLMLHPPSEVVRRGLLWVLVPPPLHRSGVAPPAPARQPVPHPRIRRKPVWKPRFSAPRAPFSARFSHQSYAPGA